MIRTLSDSRPIHFLYNAYLANKAAACVLASQFLATLVNATAKYLESDDSDAINPIQILHGRMVVTAILCTLTLSILARNAGEGPCAFPSTHRLRGLLALRAMAGVCGIMGFYCKLLVYSDQSSK